MGGGFSERRVFGLVALGLALGAGGVFGAPMTQGPGGVPPSEAPAAAAPLDAREQIYPGLEWLDRDLLLAIKAPLDLQLQVAQLTAPYDKDGNPITDPDSYAKHLYGADAPFRLFVTERSELFDFAGFKLPNGQFFIECLLHDAGYRAAEELLRVRPDFEPAALFELFAPRFLTSPSMVASRESVDYFERDGQAGGIVPLSNAGALGYLIWGMLYQTEYWADEEHDRDAFILNLLALGADSKLQALLVERALLAPLRLPEGADLLKHPGRGLAGPFDMLRAKVGYVPAHETLLMNDLALMQELKELDPSESEIPVTEPAPKTPYLEQWTIHMLDKVRVELYGVKAVDKLKHGATLAERTAFWKKLFEESRYEFARELALAELRAIVALEDEHPLTRLIDELEALGEGRTPEQEAELAKLKEQRRTEQISLLRSISGNLARAGVAGSYDLALQTMLVDLPEALKGLGGAYEEALPEQAWNAFTTVEQPRILGTLIDSMSGAIELPESGKNTMILNSAIYQYSGSHDVLSEILTKGTLRESGTAFINSEWMSEDEYQTGFDELLSRAALPENKGLPCNATISNLLYSLYDRADPAYRKKMLLKTMEGGRWSDPSAPGYWDLQPDQPVLDFVKEILTAQEIAQLVKQGKVAPGLLD